SAYNAERTIERVVLDLAAVLDGLVGERFEIVVVDDGSTDRTPQILTDLSLSRPRLHLITVSHQQARGTPTALAAGFDNARHELIFFSDADGGFELTELDRLLSALDERTDLVVGYRAQRADSLGRRV